MSDTKYDFGGWATKINLKCADGRVILKDAFKDCDGVVVPMVWQHLHNDPANILGHGVLENREDGVYFRGKFNPSKQGQDAKLLVVHKDIKSLSIYANGLVERNKYVSHGVIREVSLVLAGSNPGALIDNIMIQHSDGDIRVDEEAIIYTGLELELEPELEKKEEPVVKHEAEEGNETVGEIFNTLNDKQKEAVYAIVADLLGEDEESENEVKQSNLNEEGEPVVMKKNAFDGSAVEVRDSRPTLTHDQLHTILVDAQKMGSLKQSFLAHAGSYGIDNIDYLFPDARTLTPEPDLISRDMEWVQGVINGCRHNPFSRIKSVHADITVETARARGYIKGALKVEEVFALLRRTTGPTTIYKKQKLDRDDIIDITDLDVVAWLKREMRLMLDEEIARAVLISDGRDPVAQAADKIDETCIRPIWKDADLYAVKVQALVGDSISTVHDKMFIGRKLYKGSGSPALYASPDFISDSMLLKDVNGYRLYKTEAELAAALRVSRIVEVPLMDNLVREAGQTDYKLLGIAVNLKDYSLGADKGGQVAFFDDFDIDYNQFKYLIETRCSGALTMPASALVFEQATT